jgi:hypothetical protein
VSDQFAAVAKHARAIERLRILRETLEGVLALLKTEDDDRAHRLAVELLEREYDRLSETIDALE